MRQAFEVGHVAGEMPWQLAVLADAAGLIGGDDDRKTGIRRRLAVG